MENRLYSREEVQKILSKVINSRQFEGDRFTLEDILNIAKELNLDLNLTLLAIKENEVDLELERAKELWKQKKKRSFYEHLLVYFVTNATLILLTLFVWRELFIFFLISTAFGGIALIANFIESFYPSEIKVEKNAKKLLNQMKRKEKIDNIIDSFLEKLTKIFR